MCLAVPGKIVEIKGDKAVVDYGPEKREGLIVSGDYSVGDYVIIQGKVLIQKIPKEEAKRALEFYIEALEK